MLVDHESISIGQAVFTSSQGNSGGGYQLVARSPEVRAPLARQLSRWGPAHGSLLADAPDGSCFNYLSIDSEWSIVSRTLYGGPEYSCRGALQIVTFILALRHEQLAGYRNDPLRLARTAMLLGHLRLSANLTESLPDVRLPPLPPHAVGNERGGELEQDEILLRALRLLDQGERIALIAGQSTSAILQSIFEQTSFERRLQLSFTTGLKPSPNRPFRIHLLQFVDRRIHHQLSALGIRLVAATV